MKYSLRKSFSYRRRKEPLDDDHTNPRIDTHGLSNSNSNLVKSNQSKSFLRRQRRYSSSPPARSSPDRTSSKSSDHGYNNHMNYVHDDDVDCDNDDPFSLASNTKTRVRPFDRLTNQIRKSFRNTLTRQRPRLESTNSNKRLLLKKHDENLPVDTNLLPISTGLTSPLIRPTQPTSTNENEKIKISPKRRKAPLAPTYMYHSITVPNSDCPTLCMSEHPDLDCVSSSNDQPQNLSTKKNKFNPSFRTRLSRLLKKRHAKQQQHVQIQNCSDEDADHQHLDDDHDEIDHKKLTLGQRFDTLRRSLHIGNRNSATKGKRHLLSNE
ncbi:unnamed protein product [Rotaria magnacalcarata]|uniref:Uncharacterized protein n=1 Tax=Rotaria magnacalcarata TaxID=392030 RepID=A0A819F8Y1_9BILA|nr:unnamed protein product [Rotaria magnacalcarata]CAF3864476.1 unnamed protein product [Rotaria magnacalcarata]